MTTITASDLDSLLNLDGEVDDDILEAMIDAAIDRLNLYGTDLPNLTGTAGSKTVSVTSAERGAILQVASAVYSVSKSTGSTSTSRGIGGLNISESSSQGNRMLEDMVKDAAARLKELDVSYG